MFVEGLCLYCRMQWRYTFCLFIVVTPVRFVSYESRYEFQICDVFIWWGVGRPVRYWYLTD